MAAKMAVLVVVEGVLGQARLVEAEQEQPTVEAAQQGMRKGVGEVLEEVVAVEEEALVHHVEAVEAVVATLHHAEAEEEVVVAAQEALARSCCWKRLKDRGLRRVVKSLDFHWIMLVCLSTDCSKVEKFSESGSVRLLKC